MKKTIIVSALVALLVNFLCAYPVLLFIGIWLALGRLTVYVGEKIEGMFDWPIKAMCYLIPLPLLPIIVLCGSHQFYWEFPNFPRFRSPIYFKKEE